VRLLGLSCDCTAASHPGRGSVKRRRLRTSCSPVIAAAILAGLWSGAGEAQPSASVDAASLRHELEVAEIRGKESPLAANLWFFQPDNWELLVKVLDACQVNNRYWVFFAATTNVRFELTVTDTQTQMVKTYTNPLGQAANAITDTDAFATCP